MITANVWTDFLELVKTNPLVLEAIAVVVLFVIALLAFGAWALVGPEPRLAHALLAA